MKKIVLIICLFFFFSCHDKEQKKELLSLQITLDSLITQQYYFLDNMESSPLKDTQEINTIRTGAAYLSENINTPDFPRLYTEFNEYYGDSMFALSVWKDKDYIKCKIKLMEYYSLNQILKYFYESHFQVETIGIVALNDRVRKGKKERVEIIPYYMNFLDRKYPIIIVGADTLEYDGFKYYYDVISYEDRYQDVNAKMIVRRWDRVSEMDASCRLTIVD
jgi:hypothetical protein